jgi:hypothetical protein
LDVYESTESANVRSSPSIADREAVIREHAELVQ